MKPLYLTIEGLQSFQERQEIDFNKIGRDGIFGIFGPTGSGKSTIIDGITLALYGSILRFKNKNDEKKDYMTIEAVNKNSNMTKVNFKFKVGNDTYRIERTYKIGKKSGNLSKTALLFKVGDSEEKIAEGHTEIYKEIKENILGLTLEDFTRSVVLPQGNFSSFLKLDGQDKRKMLERIFNLEKYGVVLTDKANKHKKKIEDSIKNINNFIENIGFNEEELKTCKEELINLEKATDDYKKEKIKYESEIKEMEEISKIKDRLGTLKNEKNILKQNEEKINDLIAKREIGKKFASVVGKVDRKNECKENIDTLTREIEELRANLEKAKKLFQKEKDNYDEKEKLSKSLYTKKDENYVSQEEYDETNKIYTDLLTKEKLNIKKNKIEEEIQKYSEENITASSNIDEIIAKIETLENEKKDIKMISNDEIIEMDRAILEKENEIHILEDKEKNYKEKLKNLEELKTKECEMNLLLTEKEEENKKFLKDRKNYLVYELEKEMNEGEPCPLCGNEYHKKHLELHTLSFDVNKFETLQREIEETKQILFSLKEKIKNIAKDVENSNISQTDIEKIKEEISLLKTNKKNKEEGNREMEKSSISLEKKIKEENDNLNKQQLKIAKTDSSLTEKNKSLESVIEDLQSIPENKITLLEIEERLSALKEKRKKTEEIESRLTVLRNEMETIRNDKLKDYEIKIKDNENLFIKKEENFNTLNLEICKLTDDINSILIENNIDDANYINEIRKYLDNSEEIEKEINEYNNKLTYVMNSIDELVKLLNNRIFSKEVYENLLKHDKILNITLEKNNRKIGETKNQIKNLEEKKKLVEDKLDSKQKLEIELNPAKEIAELLKGRKFIEFLAAGKLQAITRIASDTLQKITNGRYRINVDEKSDFSIMDNFSSAIRKPQSLSGGETFMVSLCLALALANQIQLRGKSKLEFFFLDEGFGTLDSSLLEIVFTVLENLKSYGMTVGIITHVEEIKNRVPRKLIVTPAKIGVSGTLVKEI